MRKPIRLQSVLPYLALPILLSSCQQKEKRIIFSYYEDGKEKEVRIYPDYKDTLTYKLEYYNMNRTPGMISYIRNGKPQGPQMVFYSFGGPLDSGYVMNGQYTGIRKRWHDNGQLERWDSISTPCPHGDCMGHTRRYTKNGILIADYNMTDKGVTGFTVSAAMENGELPSSSSQVARQIWNQGQMVREEKVAVNVLTVAKQK